MKSKKPIIFGLIVLLIVVGVLFFFKYFKKPQQPNQPVLKFPTLSTTSPNIIPNQTPLPSLTQTTSTQSLQTSTFTNSTHLSQTEIEEIIKKAESLPSPGDFISAKIKSINTSKKSFVVEKDDKLITILTNNQTEFVYLVCPKNIGYEGANCKWKKAKFSDLKIGKKVNLLIKEVKNNNTFLVELVEIES